MMGLRFVIVDDRELHLSTTRGLLQRAGFPEGDIWPKDGQTFKEWGKAFEKVIQLTHSGWDPFENCIVLLLDLALDEEPLSFENGLKEVQRFASTALDPYVRIAYSHYSPNAKERGGAEFDSLISKQVILTAPSEKAQAILVAGIQKALASWERRTGRKAPTNLSPQYLPRDSAGARAAEAALGRDTLSSIIGEVIGEGWDSVEAHVLTGGYSGAYVLRIEGRRGASRKGVVCKIAGSKALLEYELSAWRRALESYSSFVGLVPPLDTNLRPSVVSPAIWYMIQSNVPGETLVEALQRQQIDDKPDEMLFEKIKVTIQRLEDYFVSTTSGVRELSSPFPVLSLAPVDIHRFESSISLLRNLRHQCVQRGYLEPADWHSDSEIDRFVGEVVKNWEPAVRAAGLEFIPTVEQHGDLNPRNIILATGSPQLIDWARFNSWPLGYDLVRLELQILLRCVGYAGASDYFPGVVRDAMNVWAKLDLGVQEGDGDGPWPGLKRDDLVVWFLVRNRAIQKKIQLLYSEVNGRSCENILYLCRTFDAIKMCSYQDASPFKKLWCLLIALHSASRAGLLS